MGGRHAPDYQEGNLMSAKEKLFTDWQALYETVPPLLAEDEKTIPMISADLGISYDAAHQLIERWIRDGKIISVGLRWQKGRAPAKAYKLIT